MCSCCGTKTMAIEYPDRIVVKAGAHFLIIPKPLTAEVA